MDTDFLVKQDGHIKKNCKKCFVLLTEENAVKIKPKMTWRNVCKKCRSASVVEYQKRHSNRRKAYVNEYVRRVGRVKKYECEHCKKLCYKKYKRAFCSDECRFLAYVQLSDDCWTWIGAKNRRGYGKLSFRKNKTMPAHRASYILFKGDIPSGMLVCHSCDNPPCVKPAHLWLGTISDNVCDMIKKNRSPNQKLTTEMVIDIRNKFENGYTQKKLQEVFNISNGIISQIVNRKIWKHVK